MNNSRCFSAKIFTKQILDLEKIKEQILKLYDECLENPLPFHKKINICIVPDYLARLVLEATDINIFNYVITIDNYGISHTILKHGNPLTESKRGQIAIQKQDFIVMIDVILKPDEVKIAGKTNKTGLPLLQFEKEIEGKKIVVKEIRTVTSTKKK